MIFRMFLGIGMLGLLTCYGMELVKDGKPVSEIVVADDASGGTLLAARDLQLHLQKITGAKLQIVTPEKARSGNLICVGESRISRETGYKMPSFKRSGYDILVKGNRIILTGPVTPYKALRSLYQNDLHEQRRLFSLGQESAFAEEDCGPMHAVSAFLEHLGVRFYAPYEDGTIIPHRKTVTVKDFRETKTAAFARRVYCGRFQEKDPEGAMWFRRLKSGSCLPPVGVLPLTAVLKNDVKPEWVALDKNGNRLTTNEGCIFPRFTEKSFQQACARHVRRMLDANPGMKELELVLPVLRGKSDSRDWEAWLTRKVYPQPVFADIMTAFYLAVADEVRKTHPDRILTCRSEFPSPEYRQKLTGNLKFQPGSRSAITYASRKKRTSYLKQLSELANWFGKYQMQQREWWNEFECPTTPRQGYWFMHGLQQVRKGQQPLISGIVIDAATAPSGRLAEVPLTHLMYYVNSKLLWDPDLDLEALLNEYCRLWFGPAAQEMKTFLNYAEDLASKQGTRSLSSHNENLRESDLQFGFELLAKAKARTDAGTVYRRRIDDLDKAFAPLKTLFAQQPSGILVTGKILPRDAQCNGDFSKYEKWFTIPGGKAESRTEFSLAVTEDRSQIFAAFRCHDPNMSKQNSGKMFPDDPRILQGDHLRIDFNPAGRNGYMAAVNSSGSFADGSSDPEELAKNGCFLGWNLQMTKAWAKCFSNRWEAEVAIHVSGCGKMPDFGDPWEINIMRCSGKPQNGSEKAAGLGKKYQYRLIFPKVDSQKRPLTSSYTRLELIPGCRNESVYSVKRAVGPVDLASPWNGKDWKNVPEMRLGWETIMPKSSGFRPDARAKIQYDDKYLYVLYQVHDQYVRGNFKNDQEMVCLDSCMEIFIQPDKAGPYFNFECNCIGTLLLYEVIRQNKKLKLSPLSLEELREIKRFSTLPRSFSGECEEPVTWRLGLQIPLSLFVRRAGAQLPLKGQVWYGNVYKCADWTSHPCWLMWKKNDTFHNPEGFGALVFE